MKTLAHLSDLHLGASAAHERAAARLVAALLAQRVDHVVLTGDVTHRGTLDEYRRFEALFAPLRDRLTVVPGNHDRGGDDVAALLRDGPRVSTARADGLYVVRVDSTAPHNARSYRSHGDLCERTLRAVDQALDAAPAGSLVAIALHHHLLRLPVEGLGEWFAVQLGWPHANELPLGTELLRRAVGRCDLVLHGHRHVPRAFLKDGARPLRVLNAGSSTALGAWRAFRHAEGRLLDEPQWCHAAPSPRPSPHTRPAPAFALQLA